MNDDFENLKEIEEKEAVMQAASRRIKEIPKGKIMREVKFMCNEEDGIENKFRKYTNHLAEILDQKNKAYGDSFTKSVSKYGLPVIGIRLSDKYNRIEHLITSGNYKENDESIKDTLLDTAGYAVLAIKYLEEHEHLYKGAGG